MTRWFHFYYKLLKKTFNNLVKGEEKETKGKKSCWITIRHLTKKIFLFFYFWFQPYYKITKFSFEVTLSQYVYHLWIFHIKNYFLHSILNIDLAFLTQLFTICTTSDHLIIKQKNLNFREKGEEGRSINKKNKEHLPQNRTAKIFCSFSFVFASLCFIFCPTTFMISGWW